MARFVSLAILALALAQLAATNACGLKCGANGPQVAGVSTDATCGTCTKQLVTGSTTQWTVTFDFSSCKPADTISWMGCAKGSSCNTASCPVGSVSDRKCSSGVGAVVTVDTSSAAGFVMQMHDGQMAGTFECTGRGEDSTCLGSPNNEDGCGTVSKVCQWTQSLAACTTVGGPVIDPAPTPDTCESLACGSKPNANPCAEWTCDAAAPACILRPKASSAGVTCRAVGENGPCDAGAKCTGTSTTCPSGSDTYITAAAKLSCADPSAGDLNTAAGGNHHCSAGFFCDGTSADCPTTETPLAANTTCRDAGANGACDAGAKCSGTSLECSSGSDTAGFICDGTSVTCPTTETPAAPGTTCRAAADSCDFADTCSGSTLACPLDWQRQGYTFKCATGMFFCGPDPAKPSEVTVTKSGVYQVAGVTLGTVKLAKGESNGGIYKLPYPACLGSPIHDICPNSRGLSNMAFFTCAASGAAWSWAPVAKVDVGTKYGAGGFQPWAHYGAFAVYAAADH
ncbi:MAG: hypothetical protein J3K34DRAFT_479200 [Monoraphidium minutum]|nr:MAG: hypothetical protein J3K34DRAFT_479200 [Monoraphidium minutum]